MILTPLISVLAVSLKRRFRYFRTYTSQSKYVWNASDLEWRVLVTAKQWCQGWQTSGDDGGMRFNKKPYNSNDNCMKECVD